MTKTTVFRVIVLSLLCVGFALSTHDARAQEDAYVERANTPAASGFFGRFFSPSSSKRGMSRPAREPATTGGGLMVPLKSFSNAFRGRNQALETPDERVPREPFQDGQVNAGEMETDWEPAMDSDSDSDANAAEADSSSRKVPASQTPPPSPQSPSTAKPTATRMSLSGSALSNPAPQTASKASEATGVANKPTQGPKPFEATPKAESIDPKGTSRRSANSSVGTTLAKSPKTIPAESKSGVKADGKTDHPSESTANPDPSTTEPLPPVPLPPVPLPAVPSLPPSSANQSTHAGTVPKSAPLPPPPATRSATAPRPSMTLKTEIKPSHQEAKKVGNAILASRSTVVPTTEPVASRTSVPKSASDSSQGLDLQTPGIRLRLTGPDSILISQNVPYEVVATNEGQGVVQGLRVRLSLPDHVQVSDISATEGEFETNSDTEGLGVVWALDRLPSGASKTLRLMIRTEQAEHFALSLDWTLSHPTAQLPIRVQQPQLQLALEGPAEVDFGSPQIYRLRVRNPGNAEAQGVMVELAAEPYGSNQSDIGDIPAGGERVVEVELTFQQAGRLPIHAKAISQIANLESLSSIEVDVRQSQLIANWNGPTEFYQGNTADYVLTIENHGLIPAINNACRVQIPLGVEVVQLPKGVTRSGDQLRWDIDRLAPGEKREYAMQMLMNKLGENTLDFQVESDSGEPAQTTLKTVVDAIADLQLSVNDPIAPAPVGQPVTYEITIANRGKKSAEDVFVIAQFSDGIEPTRVDGHTGKLIPGQAIFDAIPSIGPSERVVLRVTAEASKPGTHRFRAAVRCQGTEDDLLKEESTRFTASGITRAERK